MAVTTNKDNKPYELVIYIKPDKESDESYFSDEELRTEKRLKDLEGIPKEYYVYLVFRKKIFDKLPNRTPFDYAIELKEGVKLKRYPGYYLGLR